MISAQIKIPHQLGTVKAPNSAISNFQTGFVRTVMELLKYCWMKETTNIKCNYNSFIQIINFHGLFRNALRCRKTGACRILCPYGISKSPVSSDKYIPLDKRVECFCTHKTLHRDSSGKSDTLDQQTPAEIFIFDD